MSRPSTNRTTPGTLFRMTAARTGPRWSVALSGELDAAAGPELGGLAEMMSASDADVDFDLAGITFVDLAGWNAVHRAAGVVRRSGRTARILRPSEPVRRLTDLIASKRVALAPTRGPVRRARTALRRAA